MVSSGDFPRGGAGAETPRLSKGREGRSGSAKSAKGEGPEFFFASSGSRGEWEKKSKARQARQRSRAPDAEEEDSVLVSGTRLDRKSCKEGALVLAAVVGVAETRVLCELPGGLRAQLHAQDVSSQLREAVRLGHVRSLQGLYHVGQLLPTVVLRAQESKGSKTTRKIANERLGGSGPVKLSSEPDKVNAGLPKHSLAPCMALVAAVKSEEDKGWAMDVGMGLTAFLPASQAPPFPLHVGQTLLTVVERVEGTEETGPRALILSASEAALSARSLCMETEKLPLDQLRPGQVLSATFHSAGKQGMAVELATDHLGQVPPHHLPPDFRHAPAKLISIINDLGQELGKKKKKRLEGMLGDVVHEGRVRVLVTASQPNSSFLSLSSSPHLLRLGSSASRAQTLRVPDFSVGDTLSLKVSKVTAKPAVHFALDSEEALAAGLNEAVVDVSHLELPEKDSKTWDKADILISYPVDSVHKVRVTGVRMLDGVLLGTTKKVALKQKIVSVEEAQPGQVFKGAKVERVVQNGVFVKLYGQLKGFIPSLHTGDRPLSQAAASKALAPGTKVKVRVLYVDAERRQVVLTRKSSLVDSQLPVVADFSAELAGTRTMGYVAKVLPAGLLVGFYNRTAGFLRKGLLDGVADVETAFPLGSPLAVQILSAHPDQQRIQLAPLNATESDATAVLPKAPASESKTRKGKNKETKTEKSLARNVKRLMKNIRLGQTYSVVVDAESPQVAFVNVRFKDFPSLRGRIHATELGAPLSGQVVASYLQDLPKSKELSARLIGYSRLTRRATDGMAKMPELTLRSTEETKKRESFKAGGLVSGVVTEVHPNHGLRLSISPNWICRIPLLQSSEDVGVLGKLSEHFHPGDGVEGVKVRSVEKVEKAVQGSRVSVPKAPGDKVLGLLVRRETRAEGGGVVFRLSNDRLGRVDPTALTGDFRRVPDILQGLSKGEIRPLTLLKAKGWVVSLREEEAKPRDPLIASAGQLREGLVARGFVSGWTDGGVFVSVGPGLQGFVTRHNSFWPNEQAFQAAREKPVWPNGTLVTVKVLDTSNKPLLSLLTEDTGVKLNQVTTTIKEDESQEIFQSRRVLKSTKRKAKLDDEEVKDEKEDELDEPPLPKRAKVDQSHPKPSMVEEEEAEESEEESAESDIEEEAEESDAEESSDDDEDEAESDADGAEPMEEGQSLGWDWNPAGLGMEDMVKVALGEEGREELPASSGVLEPKEEDEEVDGKKKSSFERARAREEGIRRREAALLDPERELQSSEDFDRALLGSPHSALLWIRYMAWHLQKGAVDEARAVAAKALKALPAEADQERLNLWTALLNLENSHGSEDSLRAVFKEALRNNSPLKTYRQLIRILQRSSKTGLVEELFEEGAAKEAEAREGVQWWLDWAEHLFRSSKANAARDLMKRALKSLPKARHVEFISRFGRLEFSVGEVERGRTVFESLLDAYPKRADLWGMYVDLLTKAERVDEARAVLERVSHSGLSAHKMRGFFKRWLHLEGRFGNAKSQAAVRERAQDFVQSLQQQLGL